MRCDTAVVADDDWLRAARARLGPGLFLIPFDSWEGVVRLCASRSPPRALVALSSTIDENAGRMLHALVQRGIRPDTLVFMEDTTPATIRAAWLLPRPSTLVFSWTELAGELGRLNSTGGAAAVIAYIQQRAGVQNALARQVMELLGNTTHQHLISVAAIANLVKRKRSTVYAALAGAGLPGIEQIQTLLRLLPSLDVMQKGGRAADAAFIAGYGSVAAWRQALRERLGISVMEAKECAGWHWVVDRWLERHGKEQAVP